MVIEGFREDLIQGLVCVVFGQAYVQVDFVYWFVCCVYGVGGDCECVLVDGVICNPYYGFQLCSSCGDLICLFSGVIRGFGDVNLWAQGHMLVREVVFDRIYLLWGEICEVCLEYVNFGMLVLWLWCIQFGDLFI